MVKLTPLHFIYFQFLSLILLLFQIYEKNFSVLLLSFLHNQVNHIVLNIFLLSTPFLIH